MSGFRGKGGSAIDRADPVRFSFDGKMLVGFNGDTLASALISNGVQIVGRSFKYHRPRGVWGAWVEEPNALVDVTANGRSTPNLRATQVRIAEGLAARSVNTAPSAERDRNRVLDRLADFIPAGFYYKTFLFPNWRSYEPRIRAMAGLGRVDPDWLPGAVPDQVFAHCNTLVVGGGPAGLAAALAASRDGSVMLIEDRDELGGSLLYRAGEIDGQPAVEWVAATEKTLEERDVRILRHATAYGIYDHGLVSVAQVPDATGGACLWKIRPRRTIVATGAIERPLVFANNDRPGVMSADAALFYDRRHGVLPGRRIVVVTNNDTAYEAVHALASQAESVLVVDGRHESSTITSARAAGIEVRSGVWPRSVIGANGVKALSLSDDGAVVADALLVSGGWTPSIHLHAQARGRLVWDDALDAVVPVPLGEEFVVAGGAAGDISLGDVLEAGHQAGGGMGQPPRSTGMNRSLGLLRQVMPLEDRGRAWIDYQNDVTLKDVALAARENFRSVEHLKRYTTLGMATDQGKTSNLNGLVAMGALTGRTAGEVGTTTYRPPYVPVSFDLLAGPRRGARFMPVKRLVLEQEYRRLGAVLREYGGWLRPAFYLSSAGETPKRGETDAKLAAAIVAQEAANARTSVALFDGSPLGKIEVIGPQAARLLDFVFYNRMSTLRPGQVRYGFMLTEGGIIFDDGVVLRLDDNHFVISCSSGHVSGVRLLLEEWRQDRFDPRAVFIHDATAHWSTITVTGPRARVLVGKLGLGVDCDPEALPHMRFAAGAFGDVPVRVARVSFTGDQSYEISIPSGQAKPLWDVALDVGKTLAVGLLGIEALFILRAEKGYILVGKDTDGMTMPHDVGIGGPREKRRDEYVGRRSLLTETAAREDRKQLVGLQVGEREPALATGAHAIEDANGERRSIGYVTSSYISPNLGRPIALGLIERGTSRHGTEINLQHLGETRRATVVPPCQFDPEGSRNDG